MSCKETSTLNYCNCQPQYGGAYAECQFSSQKCLCPDPCTEKTVVSVTQLPMYTSTCNCGGAYQGAVLFVYPSEASIECVPIDPPPPGCTTTTSTTNPPPPDSSCDTSGGGN